MADWTFVPVSDSPPAFRDRPPVTLISRFEDQKEIRREKNGSFVREWVESYQFTATEADAARDFWRTKGIVTTFTKLSYDPREAGGALATVRFASEFEWGESGEVFPCTIQFVEVL